MNVREAIDFLRGIDDQEMPLMVAEDVPVFGTELYEAEMQLEEDDEQGRIVIVS